MDIRVIGASAAVIAGFCALAVLAGGLLSPSAPVSDAPPGALLIARSDQAGDPDQLPRPDRLRARTPSSAIPAETGAPGSRLQKDGPVLITAPARASTPELPQVAALEPPAAAPPSSTVRVAPAVVPKPPPRAVTDHKYDGVFTMDEIRRLKTAMRLSPDQERLWAPVAGLLRDIGRQQMAQIDAGQKPEVNMGMDMMQSFYSAANPLLQTLREDQKTEIRRRATTMGLGAYASYI